MISKRITVRVMCLGIFVALAVWAAGLASASGSTPLHGGILAAWNTEYPDSTTVAAANCQTCHQNPGGGSPWNAYGWSIRDGINDDGLSIADAILAVESLDADGDGTSNIDEIEAGSQPGWTDGDANTMTDSNGVETAGVAPAPGLDNLDPADPTSVTTTMQQTAVSNTALVLFGIVALLVPATIWHGRRA